MEQEDHVFSLLHSLQTVVFKLKKIFLLEHVLNLTLLKGFL